MKKVTASDVAALLDGEVSDLAEIERISAAIDSDPELTAAADLLAALEPDPEPPSEEAIAIVSPMLRRLKNSTLGWIEPHPDLVRLATDDCDVKTKLSGVRNGNAFAVDLRLTASDGRVTMEADWPDGSEPVGLVLGQFAEDDLGEKSEAISLPMAQVASKKRAFQGNRLEGKTLVSATVAAKSASARTSVSRSERTYGPKHIKLDPKTNSIEVKWVLPADRNSLKAVATFSGDRAVVVPVDIHSPVGRDVGLGTISAEDVARIAEQVGPIAECTVRAVRNNDVAKFDAESMSRFLVGSEFKAATLVACDIAYQAKLDFDDAFDGSNPLTNSATGWFVRLGGEV